MSDDVPRHWRNLTPEQAVLATELLERAEALRVASDGELSIREAIELAADAIERRRLAVTAAGPAEAVPHGQ